MFSIYRSVKRHYHKVKDAFAVLSTKGSFTFNLKADQNSLQVQHTTPDDKETVGFVVLMHLFLDPSSRLYFKTVWKTLQQDFGDQFSDTTVAEIESWFTRLNRGAFAININGEDITAERVYHLLAKGEYFDREEEAQKYLQSLASVPIIGPIFWYQFYEYTQIGLMMISRFFDFVLEVEKSETYKHLYGTTIPPKNRCIYCLTTAGEFTAEEHIIPESLGNDELVLPEGYVCDNCNHNILARLDEALLNFGPIAFVQVQYVPFKKSGKLPEAHFKDVVIRKTNPRHIKVITQRKEDFLQPVRELQDGWTEYSFNLQGKRFDSQLLARSLYKIALGLVAEHQGHEAACSKKFNAAREFIINGKACPNNIVYRTRGKPEPEVKIILDESLGSTFSLNFYGVAFILNLEANPPLILNEFMLSQGLEILPL